MTADQLMATPALSRYIGSDLESTARLIADAAAAPNDEHDRRNGCAQLAGMLAADISAAEHISAILIVLDAAWLAGYRVGLVDGMIAAPAEIEGPA